MIRVRRKSVQLRARRTTHRHALLTRQLEQLVQARFVRAFRDRDALDAPPARAQSFEHRRDAVKLARRGRRMLAALAVLRVRAFAPFVLLVNMRRRTPLSALALRFHVLRARMTKYRRSRP